MPRGLITVKPMPDGSSGFLATIAARGETKEMAEQNLKYWINKEVGTERLNAKIASTEADRDRLAAELAAARGENERLKNILLAQIKAVKNENLGLWCPGYFDLKTIDCITADVSDCVKCWRQAIEGAR